MFGKKLLTIIALAFSPLLATGCSQGGGSTVGQTAPAPAPPPPSPPPPPPPPPSSGSVFISGTVTFDRVPLNPVTNGLDYSATRQSPVRRTVVQAVNGSGVVLATTTTDDFGAYSLQVDASTNVQIRVPARVFQTSGARFDMQVVDNTNNNAPYILTGALANSGTANSTRNLHAASGWDGTQYSAPRTAAPFAILDSLLTSLITLTDVNATVALPQLDVLWSVNNTPSDGDISDGDLGSSFFSRRGNEFMIAILGAANNDTDEYDEHVIAHEFGHFFESALSRSDSIGGSHNLAQALDMRLAVSEGFANAYSSIALDRPIYQDSLGASQSRGFRFNIENNNFSPEGWFNEGSVHSIVHDISDDAADGPDSLAVGFGPIYRAMISDTYRLTPEVVSIFALTEALLEQPEISASALGALLNQQSIAARESSAAGETNNGGNPNVLPVFKRVSIGGPATTVCSTDRAGSQNNLGVFDFVLFDASTTQTVTITVQRVSGATSSDPDIRIFNLGRFVGISESGNNNVETRTITVPAGTNVIEVAEFNNISDEQPGRDVCFSVSVR